MCDSFRPHGLQPARLPCPSVSPWVCSNSCPLSRWCHPTISFSVILFSSCLQSFPASGSKSFLCIRWPKDWRFSFNISPSNECSGLISFRIDRLDLLAVQGTLKSPPTPQFKSINSSALSLLYVQLSHPYKTTGKIITLTRWIFVSKVMSLLLSLLDKIKW